MLKGLTVAIAAALIAPAAFADPSDWYLSAGGSYIESDGNRSSDEDYAGYIGVGWWLSEKFGLELTYNDYEFELTDQFGARIGDADMDGLNLSGKYHFLGTDNTSPYLGLGIGQLDSDSPFGSGSDRTVDVIGGVHWILNSRWGIQSELRYRFDDDDDVLPGKDGYEDWMISVGATFAFGPRTAEKVMPVQADPVAPSVEVADSDGDGVNDRRDRCPNTPRGVPVDANGCPLDSDGDGVPDYKDDCPDTPRGRVVDDRGCDKDVVMQLRDVHFEFDSDRLQPQSRAILDEQVDKLEEFSGVEVEVAGHTDSIGTDSYNQDLSQRRAKTVYDYLVNNGIASGRLTWQGYGESRPIAPNTNADGSDNPEGRSQNRRSELRVTNQADGNR